MTRISLQHRRLVRGLHKGDAGQSLIEMALASSLLMLILLGAAEFGRVAYAAIEVSNAARAGAAYGAQNGSTASDTTGIATAAANDAPDISRLQIKPPILSCVCSDGSSSTCANTDCPTSHIEETVTVQTWVSFDPLIHLPGLPTTFTLTGKAVQKCLQ
jgi:Flp pilus assembly protein TadG